MAFANLGEENDPFPLRGSVKAVSSDDANQTCFVGLK